MTDLLDWLERREDWDLLPLRERREMAAEVVALVEGSTDPGLLRLASSFLRTAGWGDDSLTTAETAFKREPSWESAVVLAGAHRYLDQVDEAVKHYDLARRLRPADLSVCLDLGDMLGYEQHRPREALAAYAQLLARDPEHPWALPSWLYLHAAEGHEGAGEQLLELAGEQPDNPQAFRLALAWRLRDQLFWGYLPEEWESGSPVDGPASVRELAERPYHSQHWGAASLRLGQRLGDEGSESLLELLESAAPLRVQLAAAMVLTRTDEEWQGSERRDILLALLDEGHPAVVVAAARLAFDEPDCRNELVERLWRLVEERAELQAVLQAVLSWFEPTFLGC